MNARMWFRGLAAAFIGGAASMLSSSFALMIMDPSTFNLGPALWHTVRTVTVLGMFAGLQTAFAYLKKSPLWDRTTERRVVRDAEGDKLGTITTTVVPATEKEVAAVRKEADK